MPGNDIRNLFRFYDLTRHFVEHEIEAESEEDFSVLDFISIHFGDNEHRHANHEHLPFQMCHANIVLFIEQPVCSSILSLQAPVVLVGYDCKMHLDLETIPLDRPPHC